MELKNNYNRFEMKNLCFFFSLMALSLFGAAIFAQTEWKIPSSKEKMKAPFAFDADIYGKGKKIYVKNCASCHGYPGKANFQKLVPPPGDLAEDKTGGQTDGSLFYKVTEGKGLMPKFADLLTDEERWQTIGYIRGFHKGYEQLGAEVQGDRTWTGGRIKISVGAFEENRKILVRAVSKKAGPVRGAEVSISAGRMFGYLPLTEPQETDNQGYARIAYPENLNGDENGDIELLVKLVDEEYYGNAETRIKLPVGQVRDMSDKLLEGRHMWSAGKVPVWLTVSYIALVIVVWGVIIYVLGILRKIKKLNNV